MFKKIALCAMLVLFLAPATVMAAGQQGQAQIGTVAGNCQDIQHQMAAGTMAQEKYQKGESQGNALQNGDTDMLRNRSCDQDCDQDQAMARNMTRDQIRLDSESVQQQDGSAEQVQNQFGNTKGNGQGIMAGFADLIGAPFRYMGGLFQAQGQ